LWMTDPRGAQISIKFYLSVTCPEIGQPQTTEYP
jgi:hypothetical protein